MGAGWLSVDPHGGDQLVERPVRLQLLVIASEDGFDVLPGGVARTADDGPEALKDICVAVPEPSSLPDDPRDLQEPRPDDSALNGSTLEMSAQGNGGPASHGVLAAPPAMTRSIGSDLFWFGRYLERVDSTARLLRTVLDTSNDLGSEHSRAATTAQAVLLGAVTHVTTTYPGFQALDPTDPDAVHREILSLLTDAGRPGSLAQSYSSLAHTTRTLRDLVSDDVWPIIARMRGSFGTLNGSDLQPLEQGLTDVVDGCLTLSGAVADSMPRNLGWDFTEAGRKLERTMGLLALLRVALGHRRSRAAEIRIATAIAQITESGASYRRSFHAAVQPELLLELLLHDTTLPRSIAFQIERLGSTLDRLPEVEPAPELRAPWTSLRSRIASWEPRSLLRPGSGMLVEGGESGGAPTAMLAEVDSAIASLRELATALEDHYFRPSEATSRWGIDDV